MNKEKIKRLNHNLGEFYNLSKLEKIAKKNLFIMRKGKVYAKSFLNLCTFIGEDLCSSTLSDLCGKLETNEEILISPQV